MKVHEEVTLVFKNKSGSKKEITLSVMDMLERSLDDIHESLEDECQSSGCYNEDQNFCDCDPQYEDYEIYEIKLQEEQK